MHVHRAVDQHVAGVASMLKELPHTNRNLSLMALAGVAGASCHSQPAEDGAAAERGGRWNLCQFCPCVH